MLFCTEIKHGHGYRGFDMKQKGFSLLEVLLVMAILSLAATAAVPIFTAISDRLLLQREAALLVSELRYLRELSMDYPSQSTRFIDVQSDTYPALKGGGSEYYIYLNMSKYERHRLPNGMNISGDIKHVRFGVLGTANPVTLTLDLHGQSKYVIIDVEGRIRVSDKPPEG